MSIVSPGGSLNRLRVDLIVLAVGSDKSDVDHSIGVVDPNDDPVFISCDIEYDTAVL